jgi:hypothetical protein
MTVADFQLSMVDFTFRRRRESKAHNRKSTKRLAQEMSCGHRSAHSSIWVFAGSHFEMSFQNGNSAKTSTDSLTAIE